MNKSRTYIPKLKGGRVHEVSGDGALAFALLMAFGAMKGREALCIGSPDWLAALQPHGLERFVDPQSLVHVACPLKTDVLWAAETALRAGAVRVVLLSLFATPDGKSLRRLQLAAETGGALGIILVREVAFTSPAETRWHCQPCRQGDARGLHVSLYKNKSGVEGSWYLYGYGATEHNTGAGRLAATPAGEPVWPGRLAR
ncbi:ImuA family protein [Parvularcula sp. IMCC14364]|uniref:ImuA family protein n=1 Tax=Parvularcula sp. IMCC14364 TaxID=3067902 RepID=UPI002740B0C2|nr:hypothetical protein [Parvularcula sp. IMCC14364]